MKDIPEGWRTLPPIYAAPEPGTIVHPQAICRICGAYVVFQHGMDLHAEWHKGQQ